MRRVVAFTGLTLALLAFAVVALGAAGGTEPYRVRAIFDNASFVITGEDVKVAGVVVGRIEAVDLTADNKAAVVLTIDDPAFQGFRADARCRIRLQSLIGEQFVECEPTQPRGAGAPLPPPLRRIASGPDRGQRVLPLRNTSSPVGPDLLADIQRVPERERLRLILGELGTGLAANGPALRAAITRADPALQQADRFVATLAEQDRVLGRLVTRSDRVLAPLARRRAALSEFVDRAGVSAQAAADRGDALEASLRRLPGFLRELGPATERLGGLADQVDPALASLERRAVSVNALTARLAPLSQAAIPAVTSLGTLARRGKRTFPVIAPLARNLRALGRPLRPLAADLGALGGSFEQAGGIESLLRFVYFYTGTINGQDGVSHYIRSALGVNACADRLAVAAQGCIGTFDSGASASASAAVRPAEQALDYLLGSDG